MPGRPAVIAAAGTCALEALIKAFHKGSDRSKAKTRRKEMANSKPRVGQIIKAMEEGYYVPPRFVREAETQLLAIVKSREILMTKPTDSCMQDLCTVREYKARNFDTLMRGIQDHTKLVEIYENMGMHHEAEKCRAKLAVFQKKARNFNVEADFCGR